MDNLDLKSSDMDSAESTNELKQQILQLKLELKQKQAELDECRGRDEPPPEELEKYQSLQNKLFHQVKMCEANWSEIPEGVFQEQAMPGFKMLNTPVTFEMFDIYCATFGEQPPGDEGWGRANRPVINVNYHAACNYAHWLSEQTGWHCQLPSEQQWEYACRAGSITNYWYGDMPDPRMMVMGTGKTMPTPGPRLANRWDLHDMHGNVWEWTLSRKHGDVILCGGSWYNKANWLTSASRNISYPTACNNNWGFRLIRSVS